MVHFCWKVFKTHRISEGLSICSQKKIRFLCFCTSIFGTSRRAQKAIVWSHSTCPRWAKASGELPTTYYIEEDATKQIHSSADENICHGSRHDPVCVSYLFHIAIQVMISLELSQDLKFISGLKSHSDFKRPLTFFQILGDLMENIARRESHYSSVI